MLDQAIAFINGHLMASSGMGALIVEIILRSVKSEQPLSIMLMISSMLHKVSKICEGIAMFMDKIIPQKLK